MHRQEGPNHILHFLIRFLTCGAWLIVWFSDEYDQPTVALHVLRHRTTTGEVAARHGRILARDRFARPQPDRAAEIQALGAGVESVRDREMLLAAGGALALAGLGAVSGWSA